MKQIYRSVLLSVVFLTSTLFGALSDKSAIVYYGNDISYSMVGIHDYIIVQPELINVYSHGFKIYKDKMYAYVSINEIHETIKEYKYVDKSWIVGENRAWKSKVLDIKNRDYQEFIFKRLIEPRMKDGFENFFFDTLDSYQLATKTKQEKEASRLELIRFINEFHKRYPTAKLIINRGFDIIDEVHNSIEAVLFESYYVGVGGNNLSYKEVLDKDRAWLDIYINKIQSYHKNIISLEYLPSAEIEKRSSKVIEKIKQKGMIPYVSNVDLTMYGQSSKNAIKREVFTLIDESTKDKTDQISMRQGSLVLEYMGYIQKLYDVNRGLPDMDEMIHYAGVVIWVQDKYKNPEKLSIWISQLIDAKIKVTFASNFVGMENTTLFEKLKIVVNPTSQQKIKILKKDLMMAYEIEPSLSLSSRSIKIDKPLKSLLTYELNNAKTSTPAAITSWGGYAVDESFMVELKKDNLWVINPFEFFKQSLRLKSLIVPDVTTENGNRLLFTHIDGDGIMNRVEGNQKRFSGEVILDEILTPYKIPHSVSIIGAEIDPNGLYPKLSKKMTQIAKDMYALPNVEAATHTFTHPFKWGKIIDNKLDKKYRLKVKNYKFSLQRELSQSIKDINKNLISKNGRKAKTVFWSGDCAPRINALEHIYKNNILNINGGDTLITVDKPWLSYVGPLGVERDSYYQIYTGAQNENVFTNDWLGPFWGFKRVVQTFKLTNSPRRLKPIDIYYHLYSGSKMASLKALKYVFDWAIKQDVMPIYTSDYIPKVMDFYTASMANEGDEWLVSGMKDLKTLRIEKKNASIDLKKSKTALGIKHFENHTYISLDNSQNHHIRVSNNQNYKKSSYLISSNAKIVDFKNGIKNKRMTFDGEVDLKLNYHISQGCRLTSKPKADKIIREKESIFLNFRGVKKAFIDIKCK